MGKQAGKAIKEMSAPMVDKSTVLIPVGIVIAEPGFNARADLLDIEDLASTIKRSGWVSPIVVRKRADGLYRLIAGFRRHAAVSRTPEHGGLGHPTIPATVLEGLVGPEHDSMDRYLNLIENVQRDDLSPYDLAVRCGEMVAWEETQSGKERGGVPRVASKIGKSVGYVGNLVRVIRMSSYVIARWKLEIATKEARKKDKDAPGPKAFVCQTDRLVEWSVLAPEQQEIALRKALGEPVTEDEIKKADEAAKAAAAASDKEVRTPLPPIAKRKALQDALDQTIKARNTKERNVKGLEKADGVIAALRFALGLDDKITGFYTGPVAKESEE